MMEQGLRSLLHTEEKGRAYKNQWEGTLTFPAGVDTGLTLPDDVQFSIEKISFPEGFNIESSSLPGIPGHKVSGRKYPTRCDVTLREFQDFRILKLSQRWFNMIFDKKANAFIPGFGNQTGTLTLTHKQQENSSFKLYEVRVLLSEELKVPDFSYSDSGVITHTLKFLIMNWHTQDFQWGLV